MKPLSFPQLLKLKKVKRSYFLDKRPGDWDIAILLFISKLHMEVLGSNEGNGHISDIWSPLLLHILENKHYFSLYVFLHWKNAWCYSSDRSIRNSFFTQFLEVKNEDFSQFFSLRHNTLWLRSLLSFFLGRKINQILTFFLHLSHGGRTRRTRIEHVSFFCQVCKVFRFSLNELCLYHFPS